MADPTEIRPGKEPPPRAPSQRAAHRRDVACLGLDVQDLTPGARGFLLSGGTR